MKMTGKNLMKKYYKHTGHPEKIKEFTPIKLKLKNKSQEILKLAVRRMLPGGPLAKKQLGKLKIYSGDKHPHEVQKPKEINFSKLNTKIALKYNVISKFRKNPKSNLTRKVKLDLKIANTLAGEKDQSLKYGLKKGREKYM